MKFSNSENDNDHLFNFKTRKLIFNKLTETRENLINKKRDKYYVMKKNKNPSILYCCNGFINFLILLVEKLVLKFECENERVWTYSRRINIYDS